MECVAIELDDVYIGQFKYEMGLMRKQCEMRQGRIFLILSCFFHPFLLVEAFAISFAC